MIICLVFWQKFKYQIEPRSYMVLRLKPMGKLVTSKKNLSTRQNQGLAWSLDSNLWGNQLLPEKSKYQTEPRSCMVLGLKPMGKLVTFRKIQVLDRTKILHGPQTQTYGEISYFKKNLSTRQNQGLAWISDHNL